MASQHTDMLQQEGTFTCAVCLHPIYPFKQPVLMTFCEHVFCRACAEKQKTDEGKYRCGFCSQISDSFSILTAKGGLLSRLYNSTIMACPMGCGWTGEAVNHEAHYKSCARFKCEDCGAVILPPKKIDEHRRDECTEAVLECCYKARGCLKRVKREHLARHEADCPKRPVTCSFLSCGFECSHDELAKHEESARDDHLRLSAQKIGQLEATVKALLSEMKTIKKDIKDTNNDEWAPRKLYVPIPDKWLDKKVTAEHCYSDAFAFSDNRFKLQLKLNGNHMSVEILYVGPAPAVEIKLSLSIDGSAAAPWRGRMVLARIKGGLTWTSFLPLWRDDGGLKKIGGQHYMVFCIRIFVHSELRQVPQKSEVITNIVAPWPNCPF